MIKKAFTIIELLVVIVVIAILVSIVVVGYSNLSNRASISGDQSNLNQAAKQLEAFRQTNPTYPSTLVAAGVKDPINYDYFTTTNNTQFCISTKGTTKFSATSTNISAQQGTCSSNGMVAWWRFNGDTTDSSGNGNNLSIFGSPSLVNGANGSSNGAYLFNGTTDYMRRDPFNYGVIGSSNYNSQWSLSIWAKWSTIFTSEATLIGRQGCNGGITTWNNGDGNRYTFMIKGSGCWTGSLSLKALATMDTNWHHLVATYDNGLMAFYDNAVSQGTGTLPSMYPSYSSCFGIASTCNSYPFHGTLDDARVYNRTLSQSEVTELYNLGAQ